MCRTITVFATTDDGQPHLDAPQPIDFDETMEKAGIEDCACPIGYAPGDAQGAHVIEAGEAWDGTAKRLLLMESCIRPFLRTVAYGKIVIQIS